MRTTANIGAILTGLGLLASGCGGTSTGNPLVTLESSSYGNGTALLQKLQDWLFIRPAYAASVSQFSFCVTKLKLSSAGGEELLRSGGGAVETIVGLIDVSNSSAAKTWGTVDVQAGFVLKRIDIELHVDPERCSRASHSISYNGSLLTKDLEFRFEFSPTVTIAEGDVLKLGLTNIASALERAAQAGKFNNEQISEYLNDEVKGSGSK